MDVVDRLRRIPGAAWAIVLAGLVAAAVVVVLASAAGGSPTLTASFRVVGQGSDGYDAEYTITNPGDQDVNGWAIAFDLPPGTSVRSVAAARYNRHGNHYTFSPVGVSARVPAHGTQVLRFGAKGPGWPSDCTVNKQRCAG